jgi:ATP-dependent Clp protease ATP-binding subunit ClpC
MVRLDMSEYATYEAYERLIGQGAGAGLLTATVRERPFCVLLLDEIEKAHLNVYDLCLQIFDAGRLTDTQGRTADFRRAIIIMTSNVGSRVQLDAPVGFGRVAPPQDPNLILRELSRSFRPEFLNRIDRIVTFRPLSEETAERIARRELAHVVERGGIARRRLAVDVDAAVLPLLLREGYSPAYGARPLKRTVERMVLLPVAKVIAAGQAAPGSVLRLVARRGRVEVEVVAPEAGDAAPAAEAAQRSPVKDRAEQLYQRVGGLRDEVAPLSERKSDLLARAAAPGLWDDRDAAQTLYDEVYRIDGVLGALDSLEQAARDQVETLRRVRGPLRDVSRWEARLDALEAKAAHVAFLIGCRNARDLGDAFVTLRRVATHGEALDAVGKLARMYWKLARRHQFEVEVLDDRQGGDPPEDAVTLLVTGAGAYALLCGEGGLHQVAHARGERREGKRPADREVVRVEVLPVPPAAAAEREAVTAEVRPLTGAAGRFIARPKWDVELRHGPSLLTLRAWTDRPKAEAVERLGWLLRARVAAATAAESDAAAAPVVRRYSLGAAPLVRDARTGRTTGRLDDVLDGHLDAFLQPPTREP